MERSDERRNHVGFHAATDLDTFLHVKGTGKSITLIERHKLHAATAAALCVTDRASVQTIGRSPRTLTCSQIAIRNPGVPFNGLHPPEST